MPLSLAVVKVSCNIFSFQKLEQDVLICLVFTQLVRLGLYLMINWKFLNHYDF